MNSYCETLEKARAFVKRLTNKTANKALTDLARAFSGACFESDTDIDEFISSYDEDEIFDPNCLFGNHDNVYDFVLPKYRKIAKILFECRPIGLGTPQAMVGEGELMCLAMSPRVGIAKKKNLELNLIPVLAIVRHMNLGECRLQKYLIGKTNSKKSANLRR